MALAERDMARLVLAGKVRDPTGDRVGPVTFEEGKQVEERALAKHGEQE